MCPRLPALIVLLQAARVFAADAPPAPPATRVENVTETLHGVEIVDPYRWLEDQKSPETRAWIEAQNAYTQARLVARPGRERVESDLGRLLRVEASGLPITRAGRAFVARRRPEDQQYILYVRRGLDGKDEVLVDPHPLSADHTTSVDFEDISADGTLVAYSVRQGGKDEIAVSLRDVESGKDLPDALPEARYYGVALTPDKKTLYYSRRDAAGPRVYRHAMGTDPAKDTLVFGEGYGNEKIIGCDLSDDGRYLQMTVFHGSAPKQTEIYVQDVAAGSPLVTIVNDIEARFYASIGGDRLYLRTNWNAPNGRVLAVDLKDPAREKWKEVVPAEEDAIGLFDVAGERLFVGYVHNASSRVAVFDAVGKSIGAFALPTLGSVGSANAGLLRGRWSSRDVFFRFESYHQPPTIFRYDAGTGAQSAFWRANVPLDGDRFEVEQAWYPSKDGTKIPMFLVHRKGLPRDGSTPTILTGYGGFNISTTPLFSPRAAWWIDHGGLYAVANLRGGGEFGEAWHEAGMLAKKQNVFDDFHAAAEWLIANKYTRVDKLAVSGGSNGGLLVGAALTQRPELFRAVVCSVPLLDMLRYHQFLVARFWVPEYGSSEDPEQFQWLYGYSPYHHVQKGEKYPATLLITGDSDTRVDPLHARKMTAMLQARTGSGPERPVLLHYDTKFGHSAGAPVDKLIADYADELTFLVWQLGLTLEPAR
jgi:prolyl oligopeptidase